jgi:hypothetical protein
LCTRIHTLNEEAAKKHDPLEKQAKFDEMQQADNSLNALFEAKIIAKKELRAFRSIIQMHTCMCIRLRQIWALHFDKRGCATHQRDNQPSEEG